MKLDELIDKLKCIQDETRHDRVASVVSVVEDDGVWTGDFELEEVYHNRNSHTIELICKGRRTNFIHNKDNH